MKPPKFYRKFDYNKSLLPNPHLASLEKQATDIDTAKPHTGLTIGFPGWGLLYYLLLSHLHPHQFNFIIETGTNWGCTTIMLAQALKDSGGKGRICTVEKDCSNYARAVQNLMDADVADLVDAFCSDSRLVLHKVAAEGRPVRVAFLDASHLFADVMEEFEIILPLLEDNALVVFDNTYNLSEEGEDPRVYAALSEILKRYGGNLVNLEYVSWFTPGIAIWQRHPLRFSY